MNNKEYKWFCMPGVLNNKEYTWFCMKGTIGKRIKSDSACREG
jgi:hypothetical protein